MVALSANVFAKTQGTPIEAEVPVDHIYVPTGFDSNDQSEVIVTGFLPNLCHQAPNAQVELKNGKVYVRVTSLYYHESNPFCPEMVVPFTEKVNLGVLDKGNYEIVVNSKTAYEKKEILAVSESSSNAIDEFNYAYVSYIDREEGTRTVNLKGYNPSDCFELDKISFVSNGKDTYSVLPKMKQVRGFCPMKMMPFSYNVEVPKDINRAKVLLHVRSMNGHSVNSIFSNIE